jgi:hypothetical protein
MPARARVRRIQRTEKTMNDLIFVLLIAAFFAASVVYEKACAAL